MGSTLAIYTDIATSTSVFSSSVKKLPRTAICALGPSALVHRLLSSAIFYLGRKSPRSRGYIGVYSPPRPHIYITNIPLTDPIYRVFNFWPNYPLKSTYSKSYIALSRGQYNSVYMPALAVIARRLETEKVVYLLYIWGLIGLYTTI